MISPYMMNHLDTKVLENFDGTVEHLLLDYRDKDHGIKIILIVNNCVLVLDVDEDYKLQQNIYKKNHHVGKICFDFLKEKLHLFGSSRTRL
jgi:hypothetical protein